MLLHCSFSILSITLSEFGKFFVVSEVAEPHRESWRANLGSGVRRQAGSMRKAVAVG